MNRITTGFIKNQFEFRRTFLIILSIHFLGVLLFHWGFPDLRFKRRPDLTIELSAAAPSRGGENRPSNFSDKPQSVLKDQSAIIDKEAQQSNKPTNLVKNQEQNVSGQPSLNGSAKANDKSLILKNPKPPYPPLAVRMRLEGRVTIIAEVQADGRAGKVLIESSSGHDLLDESALETVKKWQFVATKNNGEIATRVVRIPITFNLKNQ